MQTVKSTRTKMGPQRAMSLGTSFFPQPPNTTAPREKNCCRMDEVRRWQRIESCIIKINTHRDTYRPGAAKGLVPPHPPPKKKISYTRLASHDAKSKENLCKRKAGGPLRLKKAGWTRSSRRRSRPTQENKNRKMGSSPSASGTIHHTKKVLSDSAGRAGDFESYQLIVVKST